MRILGMAGIQFILKAYGIFFNRIENALIEIYTDGSCFPKSGQGAWAAILLIGEEKIHLSGLEEHTTNNRMELTAVIKAFEFIIKTIQLPSPILLVSDSQYVLGLKTRKEKFMAGNFKTKKELDIRNIDLVKQFLSLEETLPIQFQKIKAHKKQSKEPNYNREVDLLVRRKLRNEQTKHPAHP